MACIQPKKEKFTMACFSIRVFVAVAFLGGALAGMPGVAYGGDWPHWRGPHYNGTSGETGLPDVISDANVVWRTPLPALSSASPIVLGNRVYAVSNSEDLKSLFGYCMDRDTGKILWEKEFVSGIEQPRRNTAASPSPVTDGERVYFTFGSTDIFATDLDGNILWSLNLDKKYGPASQQFGYSATPLPFKGKLFVAVMRGQWDRMQLDDFTDEDSYILCLDPATGTEIWKKHRASDGGDEAFDSYTSPIPYEHNGVAAVLTQGANYVIAHDPATGDELWRQNHNPDKGRMWRLIPSPVVAEDLVIGVQPRGLSPFGIRPVAGKTIAFDESLWIYDGKTTDVPTPVYHDGRVYLLNGVRGLLYCLEATTGKELWVGELGADSRIWASPVYADGKIYCVTESGQVLSMRVGESFELLSRHSFGGKECKSTIAIADGKLFVRTSDALYCLAEK